VSNSLSNLASGYSSSHVEDLRTNLLNKICWGFFSQQLVVEGVSTSVNLNIIQVVRVDGGKAHTAVVHLSGEDFVTEEVVTPHT